MSPSRSSKAPDAATHWLVLIHQLPQEPAALRVKIWRRLQKVGSVAIRNSMYALPQGEQTREDFQWILQEILAGGGEGAILSCEFLDGMTDAQVQVLFDAARDQDYGALAAELRDLLERVPGPGVQDPREMRNAQSHLQRVRRKLGEIEVIDFFGANGRESVHGLIGEAERRLRVVPSGSRGDRAMQDVPVKDLVGLTWVTRRNVHVDRIATAWLVRRWIDPGAVFRFTDSKTYTPDSGEVRFDMFQGEFTHEGDRCTFEVLLSRARIQDPALHSIAEVVHDIDLKDQKYGREETPGVASLFAGIVSATAEDEQRIQRGSALLDDLYHSFQRTRK